MPLMSQPKPNDLARDDSGEEKGDDTNHDNRKDLRWQVEELKAAIATLDATSRVKKEAYMKRLMDLTGMQRAKAEAKAAEYLTAAAAATSITVFLSDLDATAAREQLSTRGGDTVTQVAAPGSAAKVAAGAASTFVAMRAQPDGDSAEAMECTWNEAACRVAVDMRRRDASRWRWTLRGGSGFADLGAVSWGSVGWLAVEGGQGRNGGREGDPQFTPTPPAPATVQAFVEPWIEARAAEKQISELESQAEALEAEANERMVKEKQRRAADDADAAWAQDEAEQRQWQRNAAAKAIADTAAAADRAEAKRKADAEAKRKVNKAKEDKAKEEEAKRAWDAKNAATEAFQARQRGALPSSPPPAPRTSLSQTSLSNTRRMAARRKKEDAERLNKKAAKAQRMAKMRKEWGQDDSGGLPPPVLVQELTKSSSVSAEEAKEGKEDGNGNKEESVLGAASAQARTAQAGTAAVFAAVPQKKLPVDEEAEARQKAKHTGHIYVRYTCIKERGCVPVCGVQSDVVESSRLVIPVTLTLSRVRRINNAHTAAPIVAWPSSSSLSTCT